MGVNQMFTLIRDTDSTTYTLTSIHRTGKARRIFTTRSHEPMGSIVGAFCRLLKRTPESSDPESLSMSA